MTMSDVTGQIESHLETVKRLKQHAGLLEQIAALIIETFRSHRRLYILGNGGSAADAQHIAAELVGRFKQKNRTPLPAIALTTDSSNLTAIGNDFGFEYTFVRQIEALVGPGDLVWALSVSGASPNVIRAVHAARDRGARVIGFTSIRGTELKSHCDLCLMVDHTESDRVQEAHQLSYHIICGQVEDAFV